MPAAAESLLVGPVAAATMTPMENDSSLPKHERSKRVVTDDYLRVPGTNGRVFAIGDCAGVEHGPLPPTASVAEQQGAYLVKCFNEHYHAFDVESEAELPLPGPVRPAAAPFRHNLPGEGRIQAGGCPTRLA